MSDIAYMHCPIASITNRRRYKKNKHRETKRLGNNMSDLFPGRLVYDMAAACQVALGSRNNFLVKENPDDKIKNDLSMFIKQIKYGIKSLESFKQIEAQGIIDFKKIEFPIIFGRKHKFCDNNCELCEELNYVCEYYIHKNDKQLKIENNLEINMQKPIFKQGIIEGKKHKFCDNNCALCDELDCVCEYFIHKVTQQNIKLKAEYDPILGYSSK